jgi:hypothetical protein
MTTELLVAILLGPLILAGGVWRSFQLWTNSTADLDGWPAGYLRAFPTLVGALIVLVVAGGAAALLSDGGADHTPASGLFGVLAIVTLVAGGVLCVTIATTGRPAALIPPHLRERHADRQRPNR